MANLFGGISNAQGISYELEWGVRLLLDLLDGRLSWVYWQRWGADHQGIDFEVRRQDGGAERHQLKRQESRGGQWTIAALHSAGVLCDAIRFIEQEAIDRYMFVSGSPAGPLQVLADRAATTHGEPSAVSDLAGDLASRDRAFQDLCSRWKLDHRSRDDAARAVHILERMQARTISHDEISERCATAAGWLMQAEPAATLPLLRSYIAERPSVCIHSEELVRHLEDNDVELTDTARSQRAPGAIKAIRDDFLRDLRERQIGGEHIPQSEARRIMEALNDSDPPKLILVHGRGGCGKSEVLYEVAHSLAEANAPVLPIGLHRSSPASGQSPREYGRAALELPASPAHTLYGVAGGRRSALIFDQLDYLRMGSRNSAAVWSAIERVIDEAICSEKMTTIAACRTFDLDHDPLIKAWRRRVDAGGTGRVLPVEVKDFSENVAAETALKVTGVNIRSFTPRVRRMLCHPQSLALWAGLERRGAGVTEFASMTDLVQTFITASTSAAGRREGVTESDVVETLDRVVEQMGRSSRHAIDTPVGRASSIHALCSEGLLVLDGNRIRFTHQTLYDYLIADRVLVSVGHEVESLSKWVTEHQALADRDRLRHLLFRLRGSEGWLARDLTIGLLRSAEVRFHVKLLILGVVHETGAIDGREIQDMLALRDNPTLGPHIDRVVLAGSAEWFDSIRESGHWDAERLQQCPSEELHRSLWLLDSFRKADAAAYDTVLQSLLDAGVVDNGIAVHRLPFKCCDDTPLLHRIRVRALRYRRAGFFDVQLEKMRDRHPDRVLDLIEAMLRGALRQDERAQGHQSAIDTVRAEALQSTIIPAIEGDPERSAKVLTRLIEAVLRVIPDHDRFRLTRWRSEVSAGYRLDRDIDVFELLRRLAARAIGALPSDSYLLHNLIARSNARESEVLDSVVGAGLALQESGAASDRAIEWILARVSRLSVFAPSGSGAENVTAGILRRHSERCNASLLRRLEDAVLAYFPQRERLMRRDWHDAVLKGHLPESACWGASQLALLRQIPPERLSPKAAHRLAERSRVLGTAHSDMTTSVRARRGLRMRAVSDALPRERITRIADEEWLRIVGGEWKERRDRRVRPDGGGGMLDHSDGEFASMLQVACRQQPSRFARLALRMPPDTPIGYFTAMLRAFTEPDPPSEATVPWASATTEEIEGVIQHVGWRDDDEWLMSICRLLRNRADDAFSTGTIALIERCAESPERPEPLPTIDEDDERHDFDLRLDVAESSCLSGVALEALRYLASKHRRASEAVVRIVQKADLGDHPGVLHGVLGCVCALAQNDPPLAKRLFARIVDGGPDVLLGGQWAWRFLAWLRGKDDERVRTVVRRMVVCGESPAMRLGAMWATALCLEEGEMKEEFRRSLIGSIEHRRGVARAAADLFASQPTQARAAIELLFNDDEEAIRRDANEVWRAENMVSSESPALALAFVRSRAFGESGRGLFQEIGDTVDVRLFTDAILEAATRLATEFAVEAGQVTHYPSMIARVLEPVLIRLHEAALAERRADIAEAALAKWDDLLAVGIVDTTSIERRIPA